ncbi:Mannose-6-phosphate isomerase [Balamuthia mandrillaris]
MKGLVCGVRQYDWGKVGRDSMVALLKDGTKDFDLKTDEPYAELWMGTHKNCPSALQEEAAGSSSSSSLISLHECLRQRPEWLGKCLPRLWPEAKESGELPFLFKVLSIRKALSIQAHPDKELARELHAEKGEHYPDANYKPEMMIAATECEALCGFRPVEELKRLLPQAPELCQLIGQSHVDAFLKGLEDAKEDDEHHKTLLQPLFAQLMRCANEQKSVAEGLAALSQRRASQEGAGGDELVSTVEDLALRLNDQFPGGDVGCFVCYLLNFVRLQSGQALFLGPNEPHAYLSGDLIECMAASDNTVRAGLTPKFKDVETLVRMLTYRCGVPAFVPTTSTIDSAAGLSITTYAPPVEEFQVSRIVVQSSSEWGVVPACDSPGLWLVYEGNGVAMAEGEDKALKRGETYFLPAGRTVHLRGESTQQEDEVVRPLVIWKASLNCERVEAALASSS